MALLFGGATSDRVNHGNGSSLNDLSSETILLWFYPTSWSGTITTKSTTGGSRGNIQTRNTGDIRILNSQGTSQCRYTTSGNPVGLNKWNCIAASYTDSGSSRQHIYLGDLSSAMVELSYSETADGSGTVQADNANPWIVGNNGVFTSPLPGRISLCLRWNRVLSLAELLEQQYRPHATSGCVLFAKYFGAGTQPDWSGNGNAGTVTGATAGDHVPLGPPFGFMRRAIYKVAPVTITFSQSLFPDAHNPAREVVSY